MNVDQRDINEGPKGIGARVSDRIADAKDAIKDRVEDTELQRQFDKLTPRQRAATFVMGGVVLVGSVVTLRAAGKLGLKGARLTGRGVKRLRRS